MLSIIHRSIYPAMQPKCERVDMDLPDYTDVLQQTEEILRQCFQQYKLEEVFLSFNGGKDCTVLLDITLNILKDMHKANDVAKNIKVVYIRTKGPFREIEDFVNIVQKHYGIRLIVTEGEMRTTLQNILDEDSRLKAVLMGTRRTDPYSHTLEYMQKTDSNWPQIIRVSPLLDWSYHQIWNYILQRNVPYCSLYDRGYTSIGSVMNTWPNPSLAYTDECGYKSYLPAWQLKDPAEERAGRGTHPPNIIANGHHSNSHHSNGHHSNVIVE
ncbi:FAD synthase isoform X2 [Manduca sexta]|uniref:FAD synthase isoform X2 n=1 Tax=Manduca sexta TaxID=7130 RepID=UPI00188DE569|nr:FAD synthase isoform X2 [Manduca sexta]